MNLKDAVIDLCPPPPPCFQNLVSWREYLQSATVVLSKKLEMKVVLLSMGEPVFNKKFDFCEDCSQIKRFEMTKKGRCKPDFLRVQA